MGNQSSTPAKNEAKEQVVETSTGNHFLEVHMPTLGFGSVAFLLVAIGLVSAYFCLRPRLRKMKGKRHHYPRDVEAGPIDMGHLSIFPDHYPTPGFYPGFRLNSPRIPYGWPRHTSPQYFSEYREPSSYRFTEIREPRDEPRADLNGATGPSRLLTPARTRKAALTAEKTTATKEDNDTARTRERYTGKAGDTHL